MRLDDGSQFIPAQLGERNEVHWSAHQMKIMARAHPDANSRMYLRRKLWECRAERLMFWAAISQLASLPISLVALVLSIRV